ncbi:MAG: hypothetical protein ACJ8G2_04260 [Burkholderiales bacterium]|jgi:hypothetical protein
MPADPRTNPQPKSDTSSTSGTRSSGGKKPGDARHDKSRQAENRKELGVGEDHKTKDMEDKKRGTFP